jgi:hypothetical protein
MNGPLFVPSVFSKALALILIITFAGLIGVILLDGSISTLDLCGTLISSFIVAYIAHLVIYYS